MLQWIQVDGDLSDWPAAMPRYSIRKRLAGGSLGAGGLEDVDLAIVDKDVPVSPHVTIAPASIQALDEPAEDRAAFLYWGPQWRGMKVFNAGNLGELVLGK